MTINTKNTLALRYRPRKLKDVVGHATTVASIQHIVKTQELPNAIALIGRSGLGKTTFARMIARYINCEKGTGCGKCPSCIAMDKDAHPDYKEVNMADAGGIDAVRNLIQEAQYRPQNKIRVICCDEFHRATLAAVNCLLKPMEEPPANTLWLIATSEPDKIPNASAVLGRCQVYRLTPPSPEEIEARLAVIAKKEEFKFYSDKIGMELARASGGQVRDAVQMLEKTRNYAMASKKKGKELRKDIIDHLTDVAQLEGDDLAHDILASIYLGDPEKLMLTILDCEDGIGTINKCIYANLFLTAVSATKKKHKRIWWTPLNRRIKDTLGKKGPSAQDGAYVQGRLLQIKNDLFIPQADVTSTLISGFFKLMEDLSDDE